MANHPCRTFETGGPSSATPSRPTKKRDHLFAPELQASRLAHFHGIKLAYVRYADVPRLVEEGFQFPQELQVQGTNTFIELHGKFYPSLIREFYSNFVYKNGRYITMVKGKLIVLDEELFLTVGGLSSSGEPLGNCEDEHWDNFQALATYRSCLRDTILVTPGGLTKVGIIDHLEIATSDVEIKLTNTHDHQLGEYLIHKMGIYKIAGQWMYQEDYRTTVDMDLSNEETSADQQEQPLAQPEAPEASQTPPFGFAHLDALEQRLNQRVDDGLQALNDTVDSRLMN
ncbi:hypothetical protein Lal_00033660 [Lupinus albus]|nr:hypothetical protein Lal_00033660 [Lupinus albus]